MMGVLRAKGVVYKAVNTIDVARPPPAAANSEEDQSYLHPDVKAPRMGGVAVKVFGWFLESRIFSTFLLYFLKRNNLIHKLVTNAELEEPPVYVPLHSFEELEEQEVKQIDESTSSSLSDSASSSPPSQVQQAVDNCLPLTSPPSSSSNYFHRPTIMDYYTAYTTRQLTPSMVAERLIAAIQETREMGFFINHCPKDILKQATESSLRYQRGEAISVLDGVPIAVKDEIDCAPYPTTGGTKWLHKARGSKGDAECVLRLRQCGAILIGKTNMHELGAGTSGINPHYGATRNPFDVGKIAGGSSSGSAAVVAAGLCPAALGVDGGGSVRMPAALCGVVGLKPTFGRVPHSGVLPLNWTVGMVGVLAATVEDALLVYAAISGGETEASETPNDHNNNNELNTKLYLPVLKSTSSVTNIKLARYNEWFNDCTDEIRECCSNALDLLSSHKYGWKTVEVIIPEIETMRLAHYITIGSECTTALASHLHNPKNVGKMGWDVRVGLSVYGAFSSKDYIQAQRVRNRQLQIHRKVFALADVIVTPTTGVTAYPILNDCLKTGELDYVNGAALIRYQIAGNFLGLPAITVPVGYDKKGLPIGLQFIGKPWSEPTLLHIAFAMQGMSNEGYKKPEVFYNLLQK